MARGNARRAERPVLLLRMLQDQDAELVLNRHDAIADAQRHRLLTMRTVRDRLGRDAGFRSWGFGHAPAIRSTARRSNRPDLAVWLFRRLRGRRRNRSPPHPVDQEV